MAATDTGDYGFLVSQLGIDVTDAADQQLVASSGWPNLKVHATASVTVSPGGSFVYTHNLGYPPFALLEVNNDNVVGAGSSYQSLIGGQVTANTLIIPDLSVNHSGCTVRYYVFRLPLNQDFTAKNYDLSNVAAAAKDSDVGIKVMKPGKKYDSTDLRDYNYHSSTRAPMVHAVKQGQSVLNGSFYELSWANDLGYVPLFFGFSGGAAGTTYTPLTGLEQTTPKLFVGPAGSVKIQTSTAASQYASIIILKDPFSVSTPVNVSV